MADRMHVVEPAAAIVRSWPLLEPSERRSPAIEAVRRGLVGPDRLAEVCNRAVGMRGRNQLGRLIALLASGCESELEIWGLLSVFDVPGLGHGVRQRVVRAGRRTYRLDLAYEAERVAVEMDGERWHSDREQRESDRRRDAALAAAGWLTLRFSWQRLHFDVAGCRRDTLATLAERRAWRRSG
jgi:very-short-patch-repair endonuclease